MFALEANHNKDYSVVKTFKVAFYGSLFFVVATRLGCYGDKGMFNPNDLCGVVTFCLMG